MDITIEGARRLSNASVSISITRREFHCIKITCLIKGHQLKIDLVCNDTSSFSEADASDLKRLLMEKFLDGDFSYLSFADMDQVIRNLNLEGA